MAYQGAVLPTKAIHAWSTATNSLAASCLRLAGSAQPRRTFESRVEQMLKPCSPGNLGRAISLARPHKISRPITSSPYCGGLGLRNLTGRALPLPSNGLASLMRRSISTYGSGAWRRSFGTANGISRNQLASLEESANRNPGNANAQNSFYQLLLRANMPGILVERHQSGRFATNAATEESYKKALAALNAGTNLTAGASPSPSPASSFVNRQWTGSEQQPQAYAPVSPFGSTNPFQAQMGARGLPLHVVIQETMAGYLFKLVKAIAYYLVYLYLAYVAVTLAIEWMSSSRRPGGISMSDTSQVEAQKQSTRLSDVHGCDEAKEELQEVIEFLRNPEKFTDLGAKLPKGVLLVGPPGTGKTLLARAVAGEAGVPFFYMSGSAFDEIYVGVGAKRVRDLFHAAKSKAPAIVFIDELDAIGGKRNPRDHAHAKQTLNQLLTELDGFDQDTKIVIMAATNLPSLLDKALTRPGRFDRHIDVGLPDFRGRLAILEHHAKKIKLDENVDLGSVAARCPGYSGAELENMLNIAALRASRARANTISMRDVDWAYDRILMGSERKSIVISAKDKETTAYHEAGHAIVRLFESDSKANLYKVTILPKGQSLGHTSFVQEADKYSQSMAECMADIRVLLGGKMAEEMHSGTDKVTTGVSNDLEKATDLSYMMVTSFGMSDALGPVEYGRRYENLSSETRAKIEAEVQRTLNTSYEAVRKILTERRKELDLLAKALIQYETLSKAEVERVIRGEELTERTAVPPGPLILPIPEQTPEPPGLSGVTQSDPPESPAPPAAAESSSS
ncbi:intermembrane space AAA protease IAP-1 [Ophiocordyceps camponoti-floridani]|uniref:Intermembrane space AAA protease IAP-1 n=1 Tax=Ophiocordyceps camponoti-floridani TaxID=2030778 RepID=A0A8H4VCI6_9HYPO|nr:intermembrane space AAA protease IAP-1 [Ophiocordyceps camponoti-floridani]